MTTTLLLYCSESNGTTTPVDYGAYTHTLTRNGTPSVTTDAGAPAGTSCAFDGSGDYYTVPNTHFTFAGDYTIEAYVTWTSGTGGILGWTGASSHEFSLYVVSDGRLASKIHGSSSVNGGSITPGTRTHVAVTRSSASGGTLRIFIGGTLVSSTTGCGTALVPTSNVYIGRVINGGSNADFNGRISRLKVTDGTALYTANFTPPTGDDTPVTTCTATGSQFGNFGTPVLAEDKDLWFKAAESCVTLIVQEASVLRPWESTWVSALVDQSTAGNDATALVQPPYYGVGNIPPTFGTAYNENGDITAMQGFALERPIHLNRKTVFIATYIHDTTATFGIGAASAYASGGDFVGIHNGQVVARDSSGSYAVSAANVLKGGRTIITISVGDTPGTSSARVNCYPLTGTTSGSSWDMAPSIVSTYSDSYTGPFNEVRVYNQLLDDTRIAAIEREMMQAWDLPLYATWNPSDKHADITLSNGNLTATGATGVKAVRSTIGVASGKHRFEIAVQTPYNAMAGVGDASASLSNYVGSDTHGWGLGSDGYLQHNASSTQQCTVDPPTGTHLFNVYLDADAGELRVFGDNSTSGRLLGTDYDYNGLAGTIYAMASAMSGQTAGVITANFGQLPFAWTGGVLAGYRQGLYASVEQPLAASAFGFSTTEVGTPLALDVAQTAYQFAATPSTQFGAAVALCGLPAYSIDPATTFGTPAGNMDQMGVALSIYPTTSVGTPNGFAAYLPYSFTSTYFGTPSLPPIATGFCSTGVGVPVTPLTVTSISPMTTFGTPRAGNLRTASGTAPTVQFGLPAYAFAQTILATGKQADTVVGTPMGVRFTTGQLHRYALTTHASVGATLGTPSVKARSAPAQGFTSTTFGTPYKTNLTTGFVGTTFGTPATKFTAHPDGFAAAVLGAPTLRLTLGTTGAAPRTRFGLGEHYSPYRAYGLDLSGRVGNPQALRNVRIATGVNSINFGTCVATKLQRPSSMDPRARFGTPTKKGSTC